MSITYVMDTTSSSVDGATELERIVLIFSQKTQQIKELQKTPGIDCDSEQSNRKHQNHHKHELWLGITFYTAPQWEPDDPAG